MPNLHSPMDEQSTFGSPAPKNSAQQHTPLQTPQQQQHSHKKDDWPLDRLAELYVIRLQNSRLNWDEFQEKFYPNYHTRVRFKFYEARKLADKNELPNISSVNLPSNMQPRIRKSRYSLEKLYTESELEDFDTESEGGDLPYQTENTSAGPDLNPPSTLASKPKPKPVSAPSSTSARKSLGTATAASMSIGPEKRPTKRPRISTSSRPTTPLTGSDATTNRSRKPSSSSGPVGANQPPAPTAFPAPTSIPVSAAASAPAPLHPLPPTGTPGTTPGATPISSNDVGSKIRFDRVNFADWTYIYNLAKSCPAERERADALAIRERDQLRLIAEMENRMAEMEAELEEMRKRVEMQQAAAVSVACAPDLVDGEPLTLRVGGQGPSSSSLALLVPCPGLSSLSSNSTTAAAARQVSLALKSRAGELRVLFDELWKASLKFIPPFQLEEMGMQRFSEGVVGKIGEIEKIAEEVGKVGKGAEVDAAGGSGNRSGSDGMSVAERERRFGSECKDEN
ncbi:hypothetical protein PAAG_01530 [Paracoccidioides lutzii Pb01]|uniref:Uncharacterized protein n=1 Tax=Paracoccidioides lutzii (strain ATCC MYA-826 / Pb01) TaxID=502779 RepID=C1GSN5_PARBA|nr:hypothetical protein PAAG_01530 [Paracoccidioides lutzii Pb01]EEH39068.2 hypothetical protein PAAG_01530 [Paracoccidioides lutzii Pb01]